MPVDSNGRWESWPTRNAREKSATEAAATAEPEIVVEEAEPLTRGQKAAQARATNKASQAAAEAAIADATGEQVSMSDTDATSEDADIEDGADEEGETA